MTDEQKAWEELVARGIKDIGVQVHGEYMDRVILSVDAELKRLREEVERLKAERYTAYSTLVDRVSTIEADNARLREANELLEACLASCSAYIPNKEKEG